jgi:transcriptional regulator with XRE-family HTH domain
MYRISKNALGIAMLRAGITSYKNLAGRAGVSVNTVSRIINGGSASLPTLQAFGKALGVDPLEIMEKEE